jgi:hypothetical protein
MVTLVHAEEKREVGRGDIERKCHLFGRNRVLGDCPYTVRSSVPVDIFGEFVCALSSSEVEPNLRNLLGLAVLCEEFGFEEMRLKLEAFVNSISLRLSQDCELLKRMNGQEELWRHQDHEISQMRGHISHLRREVISLESVLKEVRNLSPEMSSSVGESGDSIDSLIISNCREVFGVMGLFGMFYGKRKRLLWRGSRDGFKSSEFHSRCDGHGNTLTIILDTEGNVFGGFTGVEWSLEGGWKSDENEESFIFTLKNPHKISPIRISLRSSTKDKAIECEARQGPSFGSITICEEPERDPSRLCSGFYTSETGIVIEEMFTGSSLFRVQEGEVFEIHNQMPHPSHHHFT